MRIDVFTTLPRMFEGPLTESIVKRAVQRGLLDIRVHDLRDWTADRHRTTDDYPYGGGAGMVMKPEPIFRAVEDVLGLAPAADPAADPGGGELQGDQVSRPTRGDREHTPIILLSPAGEVFNQRIAEELARLPRMALICGHYEGVDERVRESLATRELSVGDYILSSGEIAAIVVADAVARLVPGVIDAESKADESHTSGLLEYPQYTRPAIYRGMTVPDILLSGNHAAVASWRREQAIRRTQVHRPDLYERWLADVQPSATDDAARRSSRED